MGSTQHLLIYDVIPPRKAGDTSDFEWQVRIQQTAGSDATIPLDLTGTTSHEFRYRNAAGSYVKVLGASIVTAGSGTMKATPQLTDVGDASLDPYWGEHHFVDAQGRQRRVPGNGWWAVFIRPVAA